MNSNINMDKVGTLEGALIQHGHFNNRIYLMDLLDANPQKVVFSLDRLALENKYSKIFAKVPKSLGEYFIGKGYSVEANIPNFYNNSEEVLFLGKYFSKNRHLLEKGKEISQVLETALGRKNEKNQLPVLGDIKFRICTLDDARRITQLYSLVFKTYPFPIFDAAYIEKTMEGNVIYFCAQFKDEIIALSSAEICSISKTAEMTDFATHPNWRGHSLSLYLLKKMEDEMKKLNIATLYTIARALSYSMNISFSRLGYTYAGTLINNTNISGQIESMNVWYKN